MEVILGLIFIGVMFKLLSWFLQFLDKATSSRTISEKEPEDTRQKSSQWQENKENPSETQEDEELHSTKKQFKQEKQTQPKYTNPLKAKGDVYERYIGKRFEEKGELVVYNGFIRGYEDGGVDIAIISTDAKTINLVQCKHWSLKAMELEHIQTIYEKLTIHNFDFLHLKANRINEHLAIKIQEELIENLLSMSRNNKKNLQIRKTLYISSDKVVNLEIGKHLTMIQPNIFRYRDMKIVVEAI